MPPQAGMEKYAKAIEQISGRDKKENIPEIDFTQHTLEDGSTINTQERVIKDVRAFLPFPAFPLFSTSAIG